MTTEQKRPCVGDWWEVRIGEHVASNSVSATSEKKRSKWQQIHFDPQTGKFYVEVAK